MLNYGERVLNLIDNFAGKMYNEFISQAAECELNVLMYAKLFCTRYILCTQYVALQREKGCKNKCLKHIHKFIK